MIFKKIFITLLITVLNISFLYSKNHSDLKGLKLICDIENIKYGFEFLDETYFSEYTYHKEDGFFEKKVDDYHYLSDKKYVYLERVNLTNRLYIRINRETLNVDDQENKRCFILKTPINVFFENLKKQQFN